METGLAIVFRWLHIAGVVVLLGGTFYARFCARSYAPAFRRWSRVAVGAIVVSGIYNLLAKSTFPPGYMFWFGIKMLLVLHIFAVSLMAGSAIVDEAKKLRLMTGVVVSGFTVLFIAAWLRWISLS